MLQVLVIRQMTDDMSREKDIDTFTVVSYKVGKSPKNRIPTSWRVYVEGLHYGEKNICEKKEKVSK